MSDNPEDDQPGDDGLSNVTPLRPDGEQPDPEDAGDLPPALGPSRAGSYAVVLSIFVLLLQVSARGQPKQPDWRSTCNRSDERMAEQWRG